jgi:NAD(P)-dependent dehydrogenase (short-subunit alcohol dehydrogenase family)
MKKTVLITGATGNLGQAVVEEFSSNNYHVIGTVRNSASYPSEAFVEYHGVDLTNENSSLQFVEKMISRHQRIEAAALLAGGFAMDDLHTTTIADIEAMLKINFTTAYTIARPLFEHMSNSGGGTIILVSSRQGLNPTLGLQALAYTLSKSMLSTLAGMLHEQGKQKKISVHLIAPGTIDTDLNRAAMPTADFSSWVKPSVLAQQMVEICDQPFSINSNYIHTFY